VWLVKGKERLLPHLRTHSLQYRSLESSKKWILLLLRVIIAELRSDVSFRAPESARVFGINSLELAVTFQNVNWQLNPSLQSQ
jgi:hypothetical protein